MRRFPRRPWAGPGVWVAGFGEAGLRRSGLVVLLLPQLGRFTPRPQHQPSTADPRIDGGVQAPPGPACARAPVRVRFRTLDLHLGEQAGAGQGRVSLGGVGGPKARLHGRSWRCRGGAGRAGVEAGVWACGCRGSQGTKPALHPLHPASLHPSPPPPLIPAARTSLSKMRSSVMTRLEGTLSATSPG